MRRKRPTAGDHKGRPYGLGVSIYIIARLSYLAGYFHNIGSQLLRHLGVEPAKALQHLFMLRFEALDNLKDQGVLVVQVLHIKR